MVRRAAHRSAALLRTWRGRSVIERRRRAAGAPRRGGGERVGEGRELSVVARVVVDALEPVVVFGASAPAAPANAVARATDSAADEQLRAARQSLAA